MYDTKPKFEATVCHLLRGEGPATEVLLGERDSLFCNGKLSAPGGKFKGNEGILRCAARETMEEVGVKIDPKSTKHFATVNYYHPHQTIHKHEWQVHFLNITSWDGEPLPVHGFRNLAWFSLHDLPYKKMINDYQMWLPLAIGHNNGSFCEAEVYYGDTELITIQRGSVRFIKRPT